MKKIFPTLFCLIFLGAGIGIFIWMGVRPTLQWHSMKNWEEVSGNLTVAELASSTDSDGSTTYRVRAEYQYEYGGRHYSGDRVAVFDMGDNIGSFQEELGRKLERAYASRESVPVFVNPQSPGEAVLNREMRWGLLGFVTVFSFVFCAAGGGFICLIWRSSRSPQDAPELKDKPWLANAKWQSPTIFSDEKFGVKMLWIFAVVWNALTCYMPFIAYQEITEKQNYTALIALIFNVAGLGLIYAAVKASRQWHRFGPAPLTLDPFPAALGGHAGGFVDVRIPYDPSARFDVTLTNIVGSYSRSGSERRYREKAVWQDSLFAHTEASADGTRIFFRFNLPDDLEQSDAESKSSLQEKTQIWRLSFHTDIAGVNFSRQYDIPVYRTAEKTSRHLPDRELSMMQEKNAEILGAAVKEVIPLRYGASGTEIFFPAGRNVGLGLYLVVFGLIFATAGGFVIWKEAAYIFGSIFAVVGSLVVFSGFYTFGNSLLVTTDGTYLKTLRSLFGIPLKRRQLRIDLITDIVKHSGFQTQKGRKFEMSYSVRALGNQGEKLTLAEGLKGASKADATIKYIAQQLNL